MLFFYFFSLKCFFDVLVEDDDKMVHHHLLISFVLRSKDDNKPSCLTLIFWFGLRHCNKRLKDDDEPPSSLLSFNLFSSCAPTYDDDEMGLSSSFCFFLIRCQKMTRWGLVVVFPFFQ